MTGRAEVLGGAATAIAAFLRLPLLATIIVGVVSVVVFRAVLN
jgi:uncharacterized membrane protein